MLLDSQISKLRLYNTITIQWVAFMCLQSELCPFQQLLSAPNLKIVHSEFTDLTNLAIATMAVTADALKAKLTAAFSPVYVDALDESGGCGAKFQVIVASAAFEGVPLLQRHRQVNEAIADEIKSIHAITIKAWTPAQFEEKRAAGAV